MRVDFNVPQDAEQRITDDRRIRGALHTIRKILSDGGMVVACSHLGRPGGVPDPKLSLRPVADRLAALLGREVQFAEDCVGPEASNIVMRMKPGDVLLLENLRFHPEEKANDDHFAKRLAFLGDIYVNDAFGTAHRAHASTEGVTKYFNQAVAGYLMEKELAYLGRAVEDPERPFAAVIGGAKISGKIAVVRRLMDALDILVIGGGMVFTFAKAMGYSIGNSLLEEDRIELAKEIIDISERKKVQLVFPTDAVVANEISDDAETKIVPIESIPDGMMGLDIGPDSIKSFSKELSKARTIVWNGPMGVFESKPFAAGTLAIAKLMADLTSAGTTTIVGGGDSAAAVAQAGFEEHMSHVSTGGGASLQLLEGKSLPGIVALTDSTPVKAE